MKKSLLEILEDALYELEYLQTCKIKNINGDYIDVEDTVIENLKLAIAAVNGNY